LDWGNGGWGGWGGDVVLFGQIQMDAGSRKSKGMRGSEEAKQQQMKGMGWEEREGGFGEERRRNED
jgi:hypothetical protein